MRGLWIRDWGLRAMARISKCDLGGGGSRAAVEVAGFRVQGVGFRVQGAGSRV